MAGHSRKFFTVEQARRALVFVRPLLEEISERYKRFLDMQRRINNDDLDGPANDAAVKTLHDLRGEITVRVEELRKVGAELKDLASGLCDFPYRRAGGEVVLLCYRLDEDTIGHWHPLEGGYDARQPLAALIEMEKQVAIDARP